MNTYKIADTIVQMDTFGRTLRQAEPYRIADAPPDIVIHSTPDYFGAENSQAVIGVEMAFAYLGSTFMPPLFGVISQYLSISFLPLWLACFLVLVVVMTELCNRAVGKKTGTKIERIDF